MDIDEDKTPDMISDENVQPNISGADVQPDMSASPPEPRWLGIAESERLTTLSGGHLRRLCRDGEVIAKRNERGAWSIREDSLSPYIETRHSPTVSGQTKSARTKRKHVRTSIDSKTLDLLSDTQKRAENLAGQVGFLQSMVESLKSETKFLPVARQDVATAKAEAERALMEAADQKSKAEQAKKEVNEIKENLSQVELLAETKAKEAEEAQARAKRMDAEINKVPTFLRRLFKIEDAA